MGRRAVPLPQKKGRGAEAPPLTPAPPLPQHMNLLHDNETPSFTESGNAIFVHLFPLLSILNFFSLLSLSLTPVSDWYDYHGLCCCH